MTDGDGDVLLVLNALDQLLGGLIKFRVADGDVQLNLVVLELEVAHAGVALQGQDRSVVLLVVVVDILVLDTVVLLDRSGHVSGVDVSLDIGDSLIHIVDSVGVGLDHDLSLITGGVLIGARVVGTVGHQERRAVLESGIVVVLADGQGVPVGATGLFLDGAREGNRSRTHNHGGGQYCRKYFLHWNFLLLIVTLKSLSQGRLSIPALAMTLV